MKIAQQIAAQNDVIAGAEIAENKAIAKDQFWVGEGYTKYTFDDNSVLIQSGLAQYALDADSVESINGYVEWLGEDVHLESAEIERLLEAVTPSADLTPSSQLTLVCGTGGHYTTEEHDAGVRAALEVLAERGYTTNQAHEASVLEASDEPHDTAAAEAWRDAERAALNAAEAGWARPSDGAYLELA